MININPTSINLGATIGDFLNSLSAWYALRANVHCFQFLYRYHMANIDTTTFNAAINTTSFTGFLANNNVLIANFTVKSFVDVVGQS